MENIYQRKFEAVETPDVRGKFTLSARGRKALKALMRLFEPQLDLNHLNERLREDAGIDEHELEISTVARAPLIC
ncbi:hypothetical protein ACFFUT_04685 [Pseudohalocynthiibacter aestuariivivens]|uniref:Uncharacterized protein n=1 Tax=Pseudohalocynthiibacter aestuariivivens TaxID=1591409 RepID=A0ABV5JE85_9RHOB|nr:MULTISPECIES: hypothetical protein [Pseudohalocynthiibacter]MBS9719003.1 hypothetical protein [Pseudohalocynthiibacter aestuariivivens]MCK0104607.1 hypothetical protein [Pseudohalocynthiibacter sp. F2068]